MDDQDKKIEPKTPEQLSYEAAAARVHAGFAEDEDQEQDQAAPAGEWQPGKVQGGKI